MHAYLFLFVALATVTLHFASGDVTLVEPVTDAAYLLQIRQQRHAAGSSVQTTVTTVAKAVPSATTATANTLMALDTNVDGRIDPTEVVAFAFKRGLDPAVVRLDFSNLDTNGDGSLDSREIALALGDSGPPEDSQGTPTLAPHFELSSLSSRTIAQAAEGTNSTAVGNQGRSSSSSERIVEKAVKNVKTQNGAALVADELRTEAAEEEEVRRLDEEMGALRDQASATERAAAEEAAKAADRAAAAESERIAKEVQELEARAMEAEERAAALRARAAAEDQAARDYAAAAQIGLQDAA